MAKLEICAATIQSAINAEKAGADRIELCVDLSVGGLTPPYDMIKRVNSLLSIPVFVLIRPRPGDFCYNANELDRMKKDIAFCIENQVDGVVIGLLNEDHSIDDRGVSELLNFAQFLDVTFHRAFDEVIEPIESLQALIEMGVQRILTSGRKGLANDHLELIDELLDEAGDDLIVMPGGGVRLQNAPALIALGVKEIHSSCLLPKQTHADPKQIERLKALCTSPEYKV